MDERPSNTQPSSNAHRSSPDSKPDDPFEDTPEQELERTRKTAAGFMAATALGYLNAVDTPESQLSIAQEAQRTRAALEAGIDQLPERDRLLLRRHYHDNVDLIAIASEVGVSRATVYRRHNAALLRLAERLR